ncbi:hypothetical protein SprV_0401426100 [Sparganum proliferum]
MGKVEKTRLQDTISGLVFYGRYVDDIFCLADGTTDTEGLVQKFSSAQPSLKFTAEAETDNEIAFLDVLLHRQDDRSMQRRVFRKKTWTGHYVNFHSFVPINIKRNLVQGLAAKVRRICSPEAIEEELQHLRNTLRESGYPDRFIIRNIGKRAAKPTAATAEKKEATESWRAGRVVLNPLAYLSDDVHFSLPPVGYWCAVLWGILAVTMRKVLTGALIFAFICLIEVFAKPKNTTISSDRASGNGTAPNSTASTDDTAMNVTASANSSNTSTNGTTDGTSGDLTGTFASENTTEAITTTSTGDNATNAIGFMNTTVSPDMASGNATVTNTTIPRDDAAMNVTASANSSNNSNNDMASANKNTSNGPTSGDLTGAVTIKPPSQETKPSGEVPKSGVPNLALAQSCFISTTLALFAKL